MVTPSCRQPAERAVHALEESVIDTDGVVQM